jgi:hypothetical protein
MLAVPADRLSAALGELDPGERALLDLSLRRGISDVEIGELLAKDPLDVDRGREEVLIVLAEVLEVEGSDRTARIRLALLQLPEGAWRPGREPFAGVEPEASIGAPDASAEEEPEASIGDRDALGEERDARFGDGDALGEERDARFGDGGALGEEPGDWTRGAEPFADEREAPIEREDALADEVEPPVSERAAPPYDAPAFRFDDRPRSRRPGRAALLGILGVLAAAAIAIVLLAGGGDDGQDAGQTGGDAGPGQPAPGGKPRSVRLMPVAAGRAGGTATVSGDRQRLRISVRGLPKRSGAYEVWLYNSIVDSRSLGRFRGGTNRLDARLPGKPGRYRYVDVSREPRDGNPNHSGASVLRAPVAPLLAR